MCWHVEAYRRKSVDRASNNRQWKCLVVCSGIGAKPTGGASCLIIRACAGLEGIAATVIDMVSTTALRLSAMFYVCPTVLTVLQRTAGARRPTLRLGTPQ